MTSSKPSRVARRLAFLAGLTGLGLLGCQCILLPEDDFSGEAVANRRPHVQITGGVLESGASIEESRVHFYWYGADTDGVVRWFEWAVDDTISEDSWHRTTNFDEVISTSASDLGSDGRFGEWHTFYIRSVDDRYERSRPDLRYFNAHTISPTSKIVEPEPVLDASWASTLLMTWAGEDLDASSADRLPAWFEIKHVANTGIDLTREDQVRRLFEEGRNLLLSPRKDDYPDDSLYFREVSRAWLRVPGTVTQQWLTNMSIGGSYGFGVRAIDEAGAIEQQFVRNENWVFWMVRPALIRVTIFEPSLGSHYFDTSVFAEPWEVTVAPGQRFRLRWVADASASGTQPGPCNYGFDIPDPEDPNEPFRATDGMGGWIGWAPRLQMQDPVSFPADGPSTHHFYLKMRDISNKAETETKCYVRITVAQFDFTRRFLIVDDQRRRPNSPHSGAVPSNDADEDAWRAQMLRSLPDFMPAGEVPGEYSVFPNEQTGTTVEIPDNFLDILGEYQTVIWDCAAPDAVGLERAANDMLLSRYVGAGGNMLLYCWVGPVSNITQAFSHTRAEPFEPTPDLLESTWNQFGFLWQHLHLRGAVHKPTTKDGVDLQRDRRSLVRAVAKDPSYPDIALDYSRWGGPVGGRGSHFYEVLYPDPDEQGLEPWYDREEGLETIYTARCWTTINHDFNDRPIAWRTFVTDEDRAAGLERGRIVCFAFHPYFFDVTSTEAAFSRSLMWLTEERQ